MVWKGCVTRPSNVPIFSDEWRRNNFFNISKCAKTVSAVSLHIIIEFKASFSFENDFLPIRRYFDWKLECKFTSAGIHLKWTSASGHYVTLWSQDNHLGTRFAAQLTRFYVTNLLYWAHWSVNLKSHKSQFIKTTLPKLLKFVDIENWTLKKLSSEHLLQGSTQPTT